MYKTILVYLASTQTAGLLSEVGAYLADRQGARLIGAHNSSRISIYGGIPSDLLAQHNHRQRAEAEQIETTFKAAASERNLAHEMRHKSLRDTEVLGDIIDQAHTADLVIACNNDEDDPLNGFHDVSIRLALDTGRPVLLVPPKAKFTTIGERITLAWNHSRESARAAFDALPLLQMAASVDVLAVNSTRDSAVHPGEDIASALTAHGVKATARTAGTSSRSEGAALLDEVAAHNSDLLVMGCYGHSRLREMVLGGVTKHVLKTMTVPVLMSH